ncbi:cation transporter [Sphingobacterium faecium]|uniref:cation transporter n=1 Tax=Sphingobacterium faecium TaxID=34087 RepID=UPI00320B1BF9
MKKTSYKISKMDCPSEEQMIRMKLEDINNIKELDFDIPNRSLYVYHEGDSQPILSALDDLNLNTKQIISEEITDYKAKDESQNQSRLLWTVLIINFLFFGLEMVFGFFSKSMGLVADSLDMLADSIVYGLALFAVGGPMIRKKNIAKFAGYFQILLALIGFIEVIRRFMGLEEIPNFNTMIIISGFALVANMFCLYLLQKNKSNEAHMQASMIFTSNDVIINASVIVAGLLVNWLDSTYPDLIIGAIVFIIVAQGAFRILKMSK